MPPPVTSYPRIQGEGCDPGSVQDKRFRNVQGYESNNAIPVSLPNADVVPVPGDGVHQPVVDQNESCRSVRVAGRLRSGQAALDLQDAQALSELDDCGIRRRERRLGRGGRMIPWVEVRHQGQWKWITWEQYWDGPMSW